VRVLYSGLLRSPASWARVGREFLAALQRLGVEVGALRMRGFLHAPQFPLPPGVREVARGDFSADIELTFAHPGLYHRLRTPRRAGILVYEADRMPAQWAPAIRRSLDILLLPSEFCRRGALAASVPSHLVRTVPFGVNGRIFGPGAEPPASPFIFLTVASPHHRKGLRELLLAYRAAFSAADDVRLLIKTTYDPGKRPRRFPWEIASFRELLAEGRLDDPTAPPVKFQAGTLFDEDLARLYRAAHAYVQPSYGEGFGLAALEAASCGCAVITTNFGAGAEVFDRESALQVPCEPVSAGPYEYDRDSGGLMGKPDVLALAHAMRSVWEDRALLARLRRRARDVASRYSWDEAGRQLRGYLHELCERPPSR